MARSQGHAASCGILAAVLGLACGSTAGGGAADPGEVLPDDLAAEVADPVAPDEGRPGDADAREDDADAQSDVDWRAEDDGGAAAECPSGTGCPCAGNSDCRSELCVESMDGLVCSEPCQDEASCPAGWRCMLVAGAADQVYACVPPAKLCRPCRSDGDCSWAAAGADLCVRHGPDGAFCGVACSDEAPCPEGFACGSVRAGGAMAGPSVMQCMPAGGTCPCTAWHRKEGFVTSCWRENAFGRCEADRTCDEPCPAREPAPEACNGLDDDCSGVADEGVPPSDCEVTNAFGSCRGQSACVGGMWGACLGQEAAPESCNGQDDDCDGITDEGFCVIGGGCHADGVADPWNDCRLCRVETDPAAWTVLPDGTACGPGGECRAGICCGPDCDACTGLAHCTACRTGALLHDGWCVESCPTGTYPTGGRTGGRPGSPAGDWCEDCPDGCLDCDDATRCKSCGGGKLLFEQGCVVSCPPGTYATAYACVACSSGCLSCTGPAYCTACADGKRLHGGICVNECPKGTYPKGAGCAACLPGCAACTGASECTECAGGKLLLGGGCVTSCPQGTVETPGACKACPSSCLVCAGDGPCNLCGFGKLLHAGICLDACPAGMTASAGACVPCSADCLACTGQLACTKCGGGAYLHQGACVASCPTGTWPDPDTATCSPCLSECESCEDATTCTACRAGEYLVVGHCFPNCPAGSVEAGDTCTPIPIATLAPKSLSFPPTKPGTSSGPLDLTLWNTGLADLTIAGIAVTPFFLATDSCGSNLAAGDACTISITFAPAVPLWNLLGEVAVTDDSGGLPGSEQSANLYGTAHYGEPSVEPGSLDFGCVPVATTSAARTATIWNFSGVPFLVTSVATDSPYAIASDGCTGVELGANASCEIGVTFTPPVLGFVMGSLTATAAPGQSSSGRLFGFGCTWEWRVDPWGACPLNSWQENGPEPCSVPCGSGTRTVRYSCPATPNTQTRSVWCLQSNGKYEVKVSDALCVGAGPKPAVTQPCEQNACGGADPTYKESCNLGACVNCPSVTLSAPVDGLGGATCTDTLPAYSGIEGATVWSAQTPGERCRGPDCLRAPDCGQTAYLGTLSGGDAGTCLNSCSVRATCTTAGWTDLGSAWW